MANLALTLEWTTKIFRCNMEVKLLAGGTTNVRLGNKRFQPDTTGRSKFQHEIGLQLVDEYPHDAIFTEVHVPGENFFLDFFVPSVKLVVECHGRQHQEHVKHFHKTRQDFHRQQDTDGRKKRWCKLNGFRFVEVHDG